MRSLIKGHRRSDSSTSDVTLPPDQLSFNSRTPLALPMLASSMQFPALPGVITKESSAKNSPKKLLTPIKKMFGHKNTPASTTADQLYAATYGDFVPPRALRNLGNTRSLLPNLTGLAQSSIHASTSSSLLDMAMDHRPLRPPAFSQSRHQSDSSVEGLQPAQEMPIIEHAPKKVAIQSKRPDLAYELSSKADTEAYFEDDEDLKDSDALSQFLFVRDMRGGRNTSVKYYKTKLSNPHKDEGDYLAMEEMGYEVDGMSDYDYDNNGLADEDDFDDFEGNNKYDDFLEHPGGDSVEPEDSAPQIVPNNYRESTPLDSASNLLEPQIRSPGGYDTDFLNAYMSLPPAKDSLPKWEKSARMKRYAVTFEELQATERSSDDPAEEPQSSESISAKNPEPGVLARFEENSGLNPTRGLGLATNRNSVNEMMDLLGALEGSTDAEKRKSVSEVKTLLAGLDKDQDSESKRASVLSMMQTLSILEGGSGAERESDLGVSNSRGKEPTEFSKRQLQAVPPRTRAALDDIEKRMSWFNDDEAVNFRGADSQTTGNAHFSEDMLDEVNLVDEDFDFDQLEEPKEHEGTFYRSNSYKNQPRKVVVDNTYQTNKIETLQKTVTFFRTNSSTVSEESKSRSLSRINSTRSVNSFTSFNEDEDIHSGRKTPIYGNHLNTHLCHKSSDSVSRKLFSLEPINETDSPQLN